MASVLKNITPIEFDWDEGNIEKNWEKHRVTSKEYESVFFSTPLLINFDRDHSQREKRFQALGQTSKNRKLFISFTIRRAKVRVISARPMSKKERRIYEKNKKLKSIPKFKNEDEERDFWATHDSTDYIDWNNTVELDLSKLKPSTKPITIRLTESLLYDLKILANKKDVPYQSLMKIYLTERVKKEFSSPGA